MVTKEKLRSGVDCDALGYKLVSRFCRTVSIHFVACYQGKGIQAAFYTFFYTLNRFSALIEMT